MSKAKINLNKYWHKFEEILSAAGEDIKAMSHTYHDFISTQKYKYYTVDRISSPGRFEPTTKLNLLSAVRNQTPNNLHDELNSFVSKNDDEEDEILTMKNLNESGSSYKPFSTDDLYYGVNLNTDVGPYSANVFKAKRCSCYIDPDHDAQFMPPPATRRRPVSTSFLPSPQSTLITTEATVHTVPKQEQSSPTYPFNHRNIRLSLEDCQNLENEAHKVYRKFSYYDTSF